MSDILVSRIQNRRGDLVNLPQPLRPGELGWAVDTKQLFIGADPDDAPIGVQVFSGVYSTAQSIMDNQIVVVNVTTSFDVEALRVNLAGNVDEDLILYDGDTTAHVGLTPSQASSPGAILGIINGTAEVNSSSVGLGETISSTGVFGSTFPNHEHANNVSSIMNILGSPIALATSKLNIEIKVIDDSLSLTEEILPSIRFELPTSGTFVDFPSGGLDYSIVDSESFIIEYSLSLNNGIDQLSGVGSMNIVSSAQIGNAELTNSVDEIRSASVTGDIDFKAVFNAPDIVKIHYRNTLGAPITVNITNRRWNTF